MHRAQVPKGAPLSSGVVVETGSNGCLYVKVSSDNENFGPGAQWPCIQKLRKVLPKQRLAQLQSNVLG